MARKNPFGMTTAYGDRHTVEAGRNGLIGAAQGVLGLAVSAAGPLSGNPLVALGMMAVGATLIKQSGDRFQRYNDNIGKARGVEGVIAVSRGGSAALGMRGLVPSAPGKQSSTDLGSSLAAATGMTRVAPVAQPVPAGQDPIAQTAAGLAPAAPLANAHLAAARVAMGHEAAARAVGEMKTANTTAGGAHPRTAAQPPQSDGMTKGYDRRDRQGSIVHVQGYKTPDRKKN